MTMPGSPVVAGVVVGEANGDAAGGKPREVDATNLQGVHPHIGFWGHVHKTLGTIT